jgi:uncharacterized membrane protein HdeD (DUF308 family)
MDTSLFLAKLIGPLMLAIGAGLLINQRGFKDMAADFLASRPLLFLSGLLTLLGGLAIVNTHNVWEIGWPILITVLGWLAIIGGTIRIVQPEFARAQGARMLEQPQTMMGSGIVYLVLGAILSYFGYLS